MLHETEGRNQMHTEETPRQEPPISRDTPTPDDPISQTTAKESPLAKDVSSAAQIFISYRVTPDQRIAVALKRLLEASIDPAPNVFVSGAGGLRPSNIGAIPQLQAAAKSSQAFVGVITHASKAREWIFFEAGAAWGSGKLYAPLLIDVKPDELPNTIDGYQATDAADREQVERLVTELASATGGTVKSHFGTRYGSFERVLRARTEDASGTNEPTAAPSGLSGASQLMKAARYAEADALFDELERECRDSPLARATTRMKRIVSDDRIDTEGKLTQLEALAQGEEVPSQLFAVLGYYEERAHLSAEYFRRGLELSTDPTLKRACLRGLTQSMFALGHSEGAIEMLTEALAGGDRETQASAAATLFQQLADRHVVVRLLLGCHVFSTSPSEDWKTLRDTIELANSSGWRVLSLFLAEKYARMVSSGSATNQLGIAYVNLELTSLAFLEYEKASESGISVAKANMASLVGAGGVASAGLRILEQHTGSFDAASPQYPHRVRASLEEQVHEERTTAEQLMKTGRQVYHRICALADKARQASPAFVEGDFSVSGEEYVAALAGPDTIAFQPKGESAKQFLLVRLAPFRNTWARLDSDGAFAVLNGRAEGGLEGFEFTFSDKSAKASPMCIFPIDRTACSSENATD